MNRRQFNLGVVGLAGSSIATMSNHNVVHAHSIDEVVEQTPFEFYRRGSAISDKVFVSSLDGQKHYLTQLIASRDKPINVLFIFGGGALGHERASDTGGIWCPDSYEDMHILRSLYDVYHEQVGFIAIACPPVFHSKMLGYADRAFLDYATVSIEYQRAKDAFVESTRDAYESGLFPIEPYLDLRFRLLMGAQQRQSLKDGYGSIPSWQGAFRAADETQSYGVPNFWISDAAGEVLTPPFRGNVYHPHEGPLAISYTVKDLAAAIDDTLDGKPT